MSDPIQQAIDEGHLAPLKLIVERSELREAIAIALFEHQLRERFGYLPHGWSSRVNQEHFRRMADSVIARIGRTS